MRCCGELDNRRKKIIRIRFHILRFYKLYRTPPQSRFYVRTFISENLYCIQANIKLDSSPSRGSYALF